MVDYRSFCREVDTVFTVHNLEKNPLADVPPEPEDLLDKTRYQKSSRCAGRAWRYFTSELRDRDRDRAQTSPRPLCWRGAAADQHQHLAAVL